MKTLQVYHELKQKVTFLRRKLFISKYVKKEKPLVAGYLHMAREKSGCGVS